MDSLSAKSQQALDHEHETARPGRSNPNNLRDQVSVSEGQTIWPTPVADGDRQTNYKQGGTALGVAARMFPTPGADEGGGAYQNNRGGGPSLATQVKMWATPRVDDSKNNGSPSQQERHGPALNVQVKQMLPTPTSRDHKDGDAHSCQNVPVNGLLGRAVHMLPTPSSGGDSGGPHGIRGGSWPTPRTSEIAAKHTMQQIRNRINQSGYHSNLEELVALETPAQGSLSPDWVSWIMGLPVKWTSLEPLPREEYDQWLQMQRDGTWWAQWWGPWWFDCPSIATGIPDRVSRLKCLGNGIVPASLSLFLRS
jgi:hypothetical protein